MILGGNEVVPVLHSTAGVQCRALWMERLVAGVPRGPDGFPWQRSGERGSGYGGWENHTRTDAFYQPFSPVSLLENNKAQHSPHESLQWFKFKIKCKNRTWQSIPVSEFHFHTRFCPLRFKMKIYPDKCQFHFLAKLCFSLCNNFKQRLPPPPPQILQASMKHQRIPLYNESSSSETCLLKLKNVSSFIHGWFCLRLQTWSFVLTEEITGACVQLFASKSLWMLFRATGPKRFNRKVLTSISSAIFTFNLIPLSPSLPVLTSRLSPGVLTRHQRAEWNSSIQAAVLYRGQHTRTCVFYKHWNCIGCRVGTAHSFGINNHENMIAFGLWVPVLVLL